MVTVSVFRLYLKKVVFRYASIVPKVSIFGSFSALKIRK